MTNSKLKRSIHKEYNYTPYNIDGVAMPIVRADSVDNLAQVIRSCQQILKNNPEFSKIEVHEIQVTIAEVK